MASNKILNIGKSDSTVSLQINNELKVNSQLVPTFTETTMSGSESITIQNADTFSGKTLTELYSAIYPIGSIYMSTTSTNPNNFFGGTWVLYGSGNILIGSNNCDCYAWKRTA